MKWDFAIGNPPYQQETENISLTNGQLRSKSVFHFFQIEADKIARESTVLIYPAGRWIQRSGKGMASFGLEQINDHRLSKVYFYPDSKEVYGLAPTEIIYHIALSYILGFNEDTKDIKHNFRQLDALPYAKEGTLQQKLDELFS